MDNTDGSGFDPTNPYQNVPDTCDVGLLQSMEARAWQEGQRVVSQNQNLIFNPDKILQYSCFGVNLWGFGDAEMFGGGDVRREEPLNPSNSLFAPFHAVIYSGVYDPNNIDLWRNSRAYYLGGRANVSVNFCGDMNKVWHEAKCYDFDSVNDPEHNDGFSSLARYIDYDTYPRSTGGFDPRNYPSGNCPIDAGYRYTWTDTEYVVSVAPQWKAGWDDLWPSNIQRSYVDVLQVPDGGPNCDVIYTVDGYGYANSPIGTGVMVQLAGDVEPYEEGICIVPGCYYSPPSGGGDAKDGTCEAP